MAVFVNTEVRMLGWDEAMLKGERAVDLYKDVFGFSDEEIGFHVNLEK